MPVKFIMTVKSFMSMKNIYICLVGNDVGTKYGSQREREFLVLVFFEFLVSQREMEDEKREIVAI